MLFIVFVLFLFYPLYIVQTYTTFSFISGHFLERDRERKQKEKKNYSERMRENIVQYSDKILCRNVTVKTISNDTNYQ